MTRLPPNPESKIGKPQVIARLLELDGMHLLLRLQKPFEEPPEDNTIKVKIEIVDGKPKVTPIPKTNPNDESYIKYGTALIVEAWSEATKSVVTTGIKKPNDQSEEAFQFGVRYMLNHSTDRELINVLRIKGLDKQLKFQCGLDDTAVVIPTYKRLEKKKPR
jgi:hypothetical protein